MMMKNEIQKLQERDSGFRFGCPKCNEPKHFLTKEMLNEHLVEEHRGPAYNLDMCCFRNGGRVFDN